MRISPGLRGYRQVIFKSSRCDLCGSRRPDCAL